MSQPAKADMRTAMPGVADWIARRRLEWGKAHVDLCLRRGTVEKVPGFFFALERGNVVGTPFPADHPVAQWQQYAVLFDTTFAVFMKQPEGVADGKN